MAAALASARASAAVAATSGSRPNLRANSQWPASSAGVGPFPAAPLSAAFLRQPSAAGTVGGRRLRSKGADDTTKLRVAEVTRGHGMESSHDDDEGDLEFGNISGSLFPQGKTKYRRVMLKLSGEALQGNLGFGVDPEILRSVARDIAECQMRGVQMTVVVGGGNYFRGVDAWDGLDRATADYVGMMATCMNAICLQSALESLGVATRVQTAIEMKEIAEPYIRRKAVAHLEKGRVVIFGAGTGNPFFTTDTAAALRAAEIDADVLMKATKVDGVYDSDPEHNPNAKRYTRLTYRQVSDEKLGVMDETAFTLCKENKIPVLVFNLQPGNIVQAVFGKTDIGTTVDEI